MRTLTRCRQMSEPHMIALWTSRASFILARGSPQNSRRESSSTAPSSITPGKCRWTTGTRFMKRSRRFTSLARHYPLRMFPPRRRVKTPARMGRKLSARSGIVSPALHEFFGERVESYIRSRERARTLILSGGRHNGRYNCFLRYAITCLNAFKKDSISVFFPIVTRM